MSKNNKATQTVRLVLICVLATVFTVSAIMLIITFIGYNRASDLYDDVQSDFISAIAGNDSEETTANIIHTRPTETTLPTPGTSEVPPESETVSPPETTPPAPVLSEKFLNARKYISELKQKNDEVVGYIYIDFGGTSDMNISYPLVQADDNLFYVSHAYDKSELRAGSIFLDYRCYEDLEKNTVSLIFGHNMQNGAMFHKLKYFRDEQYFNSAKITVYTMDAIYNYSAFSVYNTTTSTNYSNIYFDSPSEYLTFLGQIQTRSFHTKRLSFYESDKILTLSTCINTTDDARLAVHAVLTSVEQ